MFPIFKRKEIKLPNRTIDEIKQITNILFIDDHKFEVEEILKKAGWISTRRIKDVDSVDQKEIQEAHIIFVDIEGVGRRMDFKDEGLGLIAAIKRKYPNKKVIVYSAESRGDRFHESLSLADARLSKNADPYQFETLVDKFSKECFSLNECINRIQQVLLKELGRTVETDEIMKKVSQLYEKGSLDTATVGKIFNLENAANLASIISLFLSLKK